MPGTGEFMDGPTAVHLARSLSLTAVFCLLLHTFMPPGMRADEKLSHQAAAARVDQFLRDHWQKQGIESAKPTTDAAFLRRLTLDLAGRIPTEQERDLFLANKSPEKRQQAIGRLLSSPEFALHFGSVLDEMIQGNHAGHEEFVDYLRRSLGEGKPWDQLFRELMLGPWDSEQTKPANRFLDKRAKSSDVLAVDATRVFFGVDISCAQCHDHPLVSDWTQDHFYGMVSFFHRTTGGKGTVGEKSEGEVTFLSGGAEKTAQAMFLTGRIAEDVAAGASVNPDRSNSHTAGRRAQLVELALQERTYFSRAIVNRLWEYIFGRGLVTPIDQMHSENDSSIPGLLEWLADDFADHGYDLRRLIATLVSAEAYQLSSQWDSEAPLPRASHFAMAYLRPLSQRQMAASLLLATGNTRLSPASEMDRRIARLTGVAELERIQQRLQLEEQARELLTHFDPRESEFQSSAGEALFLSNAELAQRYFQANSDNLPARLATIEAPDELVRAAIHAVLSRPAEQAEIDELTVWLAQQSGDKTAACGQLVWALVSSAEFRFNH